MCPTIYGVSTIARNECVQYPDINWITTRLVFSSDYASY